MSVFSIEPPRWLQERTSHGFDLAREAGGLAGTAIGSGVKSATTGENFFTVFKDAVNTAKDPFYMEKAEAMRANAELTHATTADKLQGMKEYPEWLKETDGDPDKMRTVPWTGTSTYGSTLYDNQQKNLWMKDYHDQVIETKKVDAENKLQAERDRVQAAKDKLDEQKRLDDARIQKSQYFKSGSDIYKVNPDTQELERVVTGKGKDLDVAKSIKLLEEKDTVQGNLDALPTQTIKGTSTLGFGGKKEYVDKTKAFLYQKRLSEIDKELTGGGSTEPTDADNRVRVKGPNGETGTVKKGDTLPEGWSLE